MTPDRSKLLRRPERRQALITAATKAFARTGFAATSLDDVAAEAGVSKVLIYRHFESKAGLYQAALDQVAQQLTEATGGPGALGSGSIDGLVGVARSNPDGFRLFFEHSAREPEFRTHAEWLRTAMTETALPYITQAVPDPALQRWAAALVPVVVIEAILAWLDAGAPDAPSTASIVQDIVAAVIRAISQGVAR